MRYTSILYTAVISAIVLPIQLTAQTKSDTLLGKPHAELFEMHYFKESEYHLSTDNASGLSLGSMINYSDVNLTYEYSDGNYHRPQQASSYNNCLFSAEGAVTMGKFYVVGGFNFKEAFEKNVQFTSILNPYRGTPYIIADSTGGNWKKQTYDMWTKIASPIYFHFISFGLDGKLAVGRGAKSIDPRPQANSNAIQVAPAFTLIQKRHSLGGNFSYRRFRENSNMILYDTGNPQKIYLMKGMGQYTYDVFSTNERERQYAGDGFGGGVQYGYKSDRLNVFLDGIYENYVENANDIENNKPRQRGRLYENNWKGQLHVDFYNKEYSVKHALSVGYNETNRSGREIIQIFNSSSEVNAWVTSSEASHRSVVSQKEWKAGYNLYLFDGITTAYKWKFSLNGKLTEYVDEYAVMNSFLKFNSYTATLNALRNFNIKKTNLLQIGLEGSFRGVWNDRNRYTPREPLDKTIETELVNSDATILTQNYGQLQAHVLYGRNLKNKTCLYVKSSFSLLRTEDKLNRNNVSASVGYNF
jgi:hypothetical protein